MRKYYPKIKIGKEYNDWIVEKLDHINDKNIRFWLCVCKCGERGVVRTYDLNSGKSSKCRKCLYKSNSKKFLEDLTEQTKGKWFIIRRIGTAKNSRTPLWECRCECGKICKVRASNLHNGLSTCCGRCKSYEGIGSYFWSRIIRNAKQRNIEFNITKEYAWQKFLDQNKKCSLSGIDIELISNSNVKPNIPASLDRIDSNKGYIEGNIQWVYQKINCMKWDLDQEEFIRLCSLIHKNTE